MGDGNGNGNGGGRLAGRTAVVTGGGRGIGRAIALGLAAEGATVTVVARTAEELEDTAREAERVGGRGDYLAVDLMDGKAIKDAVRTAADRMGGLDILVNNVGGLRGELGKLLALEHDDDLFEENLFFNLTTTYYATRAALPIMIDGGYGRVISIGSGYAKRGGGMISYTAAKHGVVGFTRALASQVPTDVVTVNCLCPGWTNTRAADWNALADFYGAEAGAVKAMAEAENVQNRILEPEELAPMAALLAAPEAAGITGQVISVDGGYRV